MSIDILSIDCATKTLGYVYASVDTNYINAILKLNENTKEETLENKIEKMMKFKKEHPELMKIKKCGVQNLLEKGAKIKDVSLVDIISSLDNFLSTFDINENQLTYILLEKQWNINTPSNNIISAIIAYFLRQKIPPGRIIIMPAVMKTKIHFHESLSMVEMKKKYANGTKYGTSKKNKQFAIQNMKYFFEIFEITNVIDHIIESKLEHVADSFMQMYSFIIRVLHATITPA
jgi:hypothetical protein